MLQNEVERARQLVRETNRGVSWLARTTLLASGVVAKGGIEFLTSSTRGRDMKKEHQQQQVRDTAKDQKVETLLALMARIHEQTTKSGELDLDSMSQTGWNELVCAGATVWLLEAYPGLSIKQIEDVVARSGVRLSDQSGQDRAIAAIEEGERQRKGTIIVPESGQTAPASGLDVIT